MVDTTAQTGAGPAPLSLLRRVIGIITSPGETFRAVVAHPRWLGMLALTTVFAAAATGAFLMTDAGQRALLDSVIQPGMPAEQVAVMERMGPMLVYFSIGGVLVTIPLMLLIVSAILFAVFNAALGGTATFRQVFAVAAHTGAIGILAQLFTLPLNYMRETMTGASSLAVMLPMLEETSFLYRLSAWVELFVIWQLVVLAIGLGVLYRRKTGPIALGLLAVYFCIALIVTAITSPS